MSGSSSAVPQPYQWQWVRQSSKIGPNSLQLISTATSLRLCHHLRLRLRFHLSSSLQKLLQGLYSERYLPFEGVDFVRLTSNAFASSYSSCLSFFDGGGLRKDSENDKRSRLEMSGSNSFNRRRWTNVLLAVNVLIYVAQMATQGKLLIWGAKVNSLIDKGQIWRLVTSSFLHANIGHLMINCYSLNSVGPTVENICGPKRYIAVYLTSAIASSAMSYWLCKSPSVGASGAIFGLVGSVAVFVLRHRGIVKGGNEGLQQIAQVILLNMAMGLMSKGIDNWGHLGGLLGGAATSWLIGPAWKYEAMTNDGRRIFSDRAPIFYLINKRRESKKLN